MTKEQITDIYLDGNSAALRVGKYKNTEVVNNPYSKDSEEYKIWEEGFQFGIDCYVSINNKDNINGRVI